jgi:hypothetical protein
MYIVAWLQGSLAGMQMEGYVDTSNLEVNSKVMYFNLNGS